MRHPLIHRFVLACTLATAAAPLQVLAADTILSFKGTCQDSLCSASGASGTPPATVTAGITLTDLEWQAVEGGFAAVFTGASAFSYTGPRSFVRAADSGLVVDRVSFFSTSASVAGIVEFDITYAGGGGYFAGNANGFGLGVYFLQDVGGILVPIPLNIESSTQAGTWQLSAVPEPAPAGLLGAGIAVLAWRFRTLRGAGPGSRA